MNAGEMKAALPARAIAEMRDISFAFDRGGAFRLAIKEFRVERGERLLLLGPSGSGKSTLLGLLCGSLLPNSGAVTVLGEDLTLLSGPARDRFRAEHIGVIFQMFNLLPYLSILDNVLLPLSFAPERGKRAGAGEARRLLASLGLDLDALAGNTTAELSVGQQQRVAAARALIGSPEIIVADEPTSALDRDSQDAFLSLLFAEIARSKAALVMVSHEESFAARFDRIVSIADIARPAPVGPRTGRPSRGTSST